jgi:hypothetical protein
MRFCDRYATYNDDVAVELELKASTAVDDDADESFDLKNYDITFDKELAGSSSEDDAAKKPAAAAADTASQGSSMVTDHLAKAQKKTMDMSAHTAIPRLPRPLTPPPPPHASPAPSRLPRPLTPPLPQVVLHAAAAGACCF